MLTFQLINVEDGFYRYEVYPEGDKENKGVLVFNPETQVLRERIDPDFPFDWVGHFAQGVMDENGNYKKEGMVAWY